LQLLSALGHDFVTTEFDLGPERYRRTGEVLPQPEFDRLRSCDALFVGAPAVTAPGVPRGVLERGIIFRLRRDLDLFVNLRAFDGIGPFGKVDIAVVRENTEGSYIGEGGVLRPGTPQATATQGSITTQFGVERCLHYAFELAARRRRRVVLVHKINVLEFSGGLWHETFLRLAEQHSGVEATYLDVDTACVRLVEDPGQFDVMVTDSLFGDIVSDLVGALAAALDRSGSADLNPTGAGPSLFEPLHAAAATRREQPLDRVDPRGAYAAIALLLEHLGEPESARTLAHAVRSLESDRGRPLRTTEAMVLDAYLRRQI
jgi:3-isopropylmalate dehydrogenase